LDEGIELSRLEAVCPECGDPLSVSVEEDRETGELKIVFVCEGDGDDKFEFEILTGLGNKDLKKLKEVGKIKWKEMGMKLVARESEPPSS
jgi:hypothetical protein